MRRDALVVGINQYPCLKETPTSKAKNLTTPAGDAEAIAQLLETYGNFRVQRLPASNIDGKLQVDPNKTVKAEELEKAIANLFLPESGRTPETALLFFAGHGFRKPLGKLAQGFLATSDASPTRNQWGMSLRDLREILQVSSIRQQIIWLDCCFSGELLNFKETDLGGHSSGCDRFFIAASLDYEVAYQQLDGKHGVLTGTLLKGLNPYQIPEYEWVTDRRLAVAVEQHLKAYYAQAKIPQTPLISNHGQPINLIQGRAEPKPPLIREERITIQEATIQEAFYLLILDEIRNQPELENELGISIANTAQKFCGTGLDVALRELDRGKFPKLQGSGFNGIQEKSILVLLKVKVVRDFFSEPFSMAQGKQSNYEALCRTALLLLYYLKYGEAEHKINLAKHINDNWAYSHHVYGLLRGLQRDFDSARFELELARKRETFEAVQNRITRALRLVS